MRVLIVTPRARDSNSFYRCMGPWSYLVKSGAVPGLTIAVAGDEVGREGLTWDVISRFDLVFMHRPCSQDHVTTIQVARNMGIPVWVEYDDWLLDVPRWNPNASVYNKASVHSAIASCIAFADVVSVSTAALYHEFKKINENVVIIPNAYRTDLCGYAQEFKERKADFVWRGTNTHDADLLSVSSSFSSLPGRVTFLGSPPWQLLESMDKEKYRVVGPQDVMLYMRYLYNLAPKVMLFPLVDCLFNHCKSNIAYQEAMHAGAYCVAPDLPEWRKPGVVTYTPGDAASFSRAANEAYELATTNPSAVRLSHMPAMVEMYGIENVNQIRASLLTLSVSKELKRNTRDPFDQLTGMWALSQLKGLVRENQKNEPFPK